MMAVHPTLLRLCRGSIVLAMTLEPASSLELSMLNKDSENEVQSRFLILCKVVVEALAEGLCIFQHARHGSRQEQCNGL